jgi:hypothetical protein
MILDLQLRLKDEKETMEKMIDGNVDKRTVFELETKNKILSEKNKIFYTEVVNLRKDVD